MTDVVLTIQPDDGSAAIRVESLEDWGRYYRKVSLNRRAELDRMVRSALLLHTDGHPLSERDVIVTRQRLLQAARGDSIGSYWGDRWGNRARIGAREPLRMLIPGLLPLGWVPMLGGMWGAGKSKFVANYVAALEVRGYRLFDYFEPAEMTEGDRSRGTVVVNVENPPEAFEEELRLAGISEEVRKDLEVIHLLEEGGPASMDLTDPNKFDEWVERLTYRQSAGILPGHDDWSPFTVVVDGITAILIEAGKSVADYSSWYSAFQRLLRVIRTPNGLPVGHTFDTVDKLLGGVTSMALPSGRWFYTTDDPLNFASPRWFFAAPRSIGPRVDRMQIEVSAEGPLRVAHKGAIGATKAEVAGQELVEKARVVAVFVTEHPGFLPGGVAAASAEVAEAIQQNWIYEGDRCSPTCLVCPPDGEMRGRHNRRHFYAGQIVPGDATPAD